MLSSFRGPILLLATVATGLIAGVFGLYAHTLMRGLRRTTDRTFVEAFQAIDRAIINPVFIPTFMVALVATGLAVLLHLGDEHRSVLPWVAVAFGLYLLAFVVTVVVHVPLNDTIKAAGGPSQLPDVTAVREEFHEDRWAAWNILRAIVTTVAFGCLAWTLVLHGRDTAAPSPADRTALASQPAVPTDA